MDMKSDYFEDVSSVLELALKVNNKTEDGLKQDINILKEWIRGQPHLPEIPDDQVLTAFLIFNKFSIENVKKKLDMYYTMRSLFPEYFENKHPLLPHMRDDMDKMYFIPLPKSTKEGHRVIMFHLPDSNPENFNIYNFFAHTYNVTELRMHEDYPIGDIIVYDFKNLKMGHLTQATPSVLKNTSTILENAFNSNVKQVHFLNYPSIAEPFIVLAKQIMNPKIAQRFHFHKVAEDITKFIPIEILPKDYGGKESSLKELNAIWKQKFADYKDRFDKLDKLRVNERLRPTPLVNDDVLGFHGNFKKLSVD